MMRAFFAWAIVVLCVVFASGTSQAQTTWNADLGGWKFHAAMSNSQNRVVGFLAVPDTAALSGDNFALVWFGRAFDGTWTSHAWQSLDIHSGVQFARTSSGDQTLFSENILLTSSLQTTVVAPVTLVSGLAEGDPLEGALVASDNPPVVAEFLAEVGYAVAPVLSGFLATDAAGASAAQSQIGAEAILDTMVGQAESELIVGSESASTLPDLCWCTYTKTTTYSAWTNIYSMPNTAGRLCIYTATRTVTTTSTGSKFWTCGACTVTAPVVTTVWGYIQLQNESQSCPVYPAGSNPPNITETNPTPP